jgi:diadenosine tetraphosphate (Ap4A) HIT family hydrolase
MIFTRVNQYKLEKDVSKFECPFCNPEISRIVMANDYAFAIYDSLPVNPGHTLIIPRRHIASLFEGTKEERDALFDLMTEMRQLVLDERKPDGFNIGINDGAAAGQTINHLHIHLIPRYTSDQPDPRGGVRWIFPDKAVYWE